MADSTLLIHNERCKAWSTNLTRLGSGLLAYVAADVYFKLALNFWQLVPLLIGVGLAWGGRKFLGLLQAEN